MGALEEVARVLLEGGPLVVPLGQELGGDRRCWIDDAHDPVLARADAIARLMAPSGAPALDLAAARWALGRIAHLAHRLVSREASPGDVADELSEARFDGMPDPGGPSQAWSVDLALRHLPSLERQARGLVATDPVRVELGVLARDWPLSSVGVPIPWGELLPHPELPDGLRRTPALRRIFLDRVAASRSTVHGRTPWVADALRADLGRSPDWLPEPSRA